MIRTWTITNKGWYGRVVGVKDDKVVFRTTKGIGVARASDGHVVLRIPSHDQYQGPEVLGENSIVVMGDHDERKFLTLYDFNTGAPLRNIQLKGTHSIGMAAFDGVIYLLMNTGEFTALREKDLSRIWTRQLPGYSGPAKMEKVGDRLVLGASSGLAVIDIADGSVKWNVPKVYGPNAVIADGLVYPGGQLREVIEIATGKPQWKVPSNLQAHGVVDGVAIFQHLEYLEGRNWKTGEFLWSKPHGSRVGGAIKGGPVSIRGHELLTSLELTPRTSRGDERQYTIRAITPQGDIAWTRPGRMPVSQSPWIVQEADSFVRRYDPGTPMPLPKDEAGRKAEAERLVRQYEQLDEYERERIYELGEYASAPLIRRAESWGTLITTPPNNWVEPERSYYDRAIFQLNTIATRKDSDLLIDILKRAKSDHVASGFRTIFLKHGDLERGIEFALPRLKARGAKPDWGDWEIVSRSQNPAAKEATRAFLQWPGSGFWWAAYTMLSGGNELDRKAVLAARPIRQALPTWQMQFKGIPCGEGLDSKGKKWQFSTSGVLGNNNDLFMRPWTGKKWGAPVYTGIEVPGYADTDSYRYDDAKTFKKEGAKWLKTLPNDARLRKDNDGDGLTDVVEKKIGTNAARADSDGDGLGDGVDPAPLIKPRKLTDKEKVVQEVFTMWHQSSPNRSLSVSVEGMAPFELITGGQVFWGGTGRPKLTLFKLQAIRFTDADSAEARVSVMIEDSEDWHIYRMKRHGGEWFFSGAIYAQPPERPPL